MSQEKLQIITPVGRLVSGSVSKWNDKDADGKPYVIKTGPKAGQPTTKCYFALAIPKAANEVAQVHNGITYPGWVFTDWGRQIWELGNRAFPQIALNPNFAWKIADGDSQDTNSKGKRNCDNPNMRGCWILHISTQAAFKTCNKDGSADVPPEAIKTGFYAQVGMMIQGNGSSQKPGVYLNPQAVALSGIGDEIHTGIDTASVGFGKAALPAGARAVPNILTGAPAGAPAGAPVAPATAPSPLPFPPAAASVAQPNPAILAVPTMAPTAALPLQAPVAAVPPLPPVPSLPPVHSGPVMTAKAAGTPYESFKAAGWTDELLRQHGFLV